MARYQFILRRPIQLIPVLIGISLVTFILVQMTPGDPVRYLLGPRASEQAIAAVREQHGLDRPVVIQYFHFVANSAQGNFGHSLAYRAPIGTVISQRIWPTVFLLGYGLLFSLVLTLVFATVAARNQGRLPDHGVRLFCVAGVGVPQFWSGLMLVTFFSLELKWFPVSGFGSGFVDNLWHMTLPAFTVALGVTPVLTRNLRAAFIEGLNSDYATAARSRGLSESAVFSRHVFWNSLVPTVNLMGIIISFLIGGTVVIESVFNIPGLGQLLVRSVLTRDYYVVQGVTMFLAFGVVITMFIVDLLTVALDPRIRL